MQEDAARLSTRNSAARVCKRVLVSVTSLARFWVRYGKCAKVLCATISKPIRLPF